MKTFTYTLNQENLAYYPMLTPIDFKIVDTLTKNNATVTITFCDSDMSDYCLSF